MLFQNLCLCPQRNQTQDANEASQGKTKSQFFKTRRRKRAALPNPVYCRAAQVQVKATSKDSDVGGLASGYRSGLATKKRMQVQIPPWARHLKRQFTPNECTQWVFFVKRILNQHKCKLNDTRRLGFVQIEFKFKIKTNISQRGQKTQINSKGKHWQIFFFHKHHFTLFNLSENMT